MALLIVQLSDIHLDAKQENSVLSRIEGICRAIAAEITPEHEQCLLIYSGDMANKGRKEDFRVARSLIDSIYNNLNSRYANIVFTSCIIPGNHDCNFEGDQVARSALLTTLGGADKPAGSMTEIIGQPLRNYYNFVKQFPKSVIALQDRDEFFKLKRITTENKIINLYLVNSAWGASRKQKDAGPLIFPVDEIKVSSQEAAYSVVVMHHPPDWFAPDVKLLLRQKLESVADIILTGHEHAPTAWSKSSIDDGMNQYVEGGVLQETNEPTTSSFNIISVDIHKETQSICTYSWSESIYIKKQSRNLQPLLRNPNRLDIKFKLTPECAEWVNDPGTVIDHPRREQVALGDIYVFPDLRELNDQHKRINSQRLRGNLLLEKIIESTDGRFLITGSDKSGKTCFLKMLFLQLREKQVTPIYLTGDLLQNSKPEILRKIICKRVSYLYKDTKCEDYEQLDKTQKVVMIDDMQMSTNSRSTRQSILEYLSLHFGTVIVFGGEELYFQELADFDASESSGLWHYAHYELLEFGIGLREAQTKRWLMLGADIADDDPNLRQQVHHQCKIINEVIKRHRLPCFPVFLLILLQQGESGRLTSKQNGSYGFLYEALITSVLDKSRISQFDIPAKYNYLSEFAHELYKRKISTMPEQDLKSWHADYCREYELTIELSPLLRDLTYLGVLRQEVEGISFKYRYNYCFFVAWYFKRRIYEPEIKDAVQALTKRLHHAETADIVVLLSHMSSDPVIWDYMKEAADSYFADSKPADLNNDVEHLNKLTPEIKKYTLSQAKPEENRKQLVDGHDKQTIDWDESDSDGRNIDYIDYVDEETPVLSYMLEVMGAFRTIEILGQVLRNSAGEQKGAVKQRITETIFDLGRRMMSSYLGTDERELITDIQNMATMLSRDNPELRQFELVELVSAHLFQVTELATSLIIKHVSSSVGLDMLSETFKQVMEKDPSIPVRAFNLSIKLDRYGAFPKDETIKFYEDMHKNHLVQSVIRRLVWQHFYLFEVKEQVKQSVCNKVKIDIKPQMRPSPQKLLR